MDYEYIITRKAEYDLAKLDNSIAKRIIKKLDDIILSPDPLKIAKKLTNTSAPRWRYRIGDYRVIFSIDAKTSKLVILVVLHIGHRKEVYKG